MSSNASEGRRRRRKLDPSVGTDRNHSLGRADEQVASYCHQSNSSSSSMALPNKLIHWNCRVSSKMCQHHQVSRMNRRQQQRQPNLWPEDKMRCRRRAMLLTRCSLYLMVLFALNYLAAATLAAPQSLVNSHDHIAAQLNNGSAQSQPPASQVMARFATPNQSVNITHVTYDPLYDTIYLGATNTIYQLDGTDLSLQYEQSTGPVLDNPSCGITECHGFEELMKPTQTVNKILVIDYLHKKLLSCGSTKQGACRRYQLNNISQQEDLIAMAVAANDDNSSTYAFIAPARYDQSPPPSSTAAAITNVPAQNSLQLGQQQVLYVASSYTKGQSRELLVPAIGTRVLDDKSNLLKLYENSFLDSARIDINSHLRDYFLVNYLYGFASSNYIYFVTVQKKATSRDFEELGYHTRLARICITDSSYNSYAEVDLKCVPNRRKAASGLNQPKQAKHQPSFFSANNNQQQQHQRPTEYPLLQDAILVDAGSQLLQSLAQNDHTNANNFFFNHHASNNNDPSSDDNKVLLGVFTSAKDHTQHAGDHSAICAFSLAQIEDKFNDNIHSCYTGKMQSRNMEYIAGNVQDCPKNGQGGNVVNFCHETLKINGTIPIVSEASIEYYNTTLTAITATSHINSQAKNIYSEQLAKELSINSSSSTSSSSSAGGNVGKTTLVNGAGSIVNSDTRQNTVVFAGTSTGHIKKILLNNATNGLEFEDIKLDPSGQDPVLADLHLHSSGNFLVAATPYKVMKVATHNCAQYANCRECSQSRNPYCGWCSLRRSCTTKFECAGANSSPPPAQSHAAAKQQLKWISAESSAKCIDLQSISPDKIPMTSQQKLELTIDRLPRLPAGSTYKCIFNRTEHTSAQLTPFGLSCPLPKLMDRHRSIQIEPGRDHANVELAVRSPETQTDFLDGKVTFFDCQRHTTCKDCLTTSWGCSWCLHENVCLFNTSKCERTSSRQQSAAAAALLLARANSNSNGQQQHQNTISLVQQCPTFDVGHQQEIVIADGSEKELSIRVKNMPQFKGSIKCLVEIETNEISLKATIREDRIICENSTYSYAADVGLLKGQLKVIYAETSMLVDRTNFTLYKCHLLGSYLNRPDCSLCSRIDRRFQCAWCSAGCRHRAHCPTDQLAGGESAAACPAPRIDSVHPLAGPTLGGTRVTIEGSNLGASFDEIANRVTIGNVPCRPIEQDYRPSNRIVCLTSAVTSARFLGTSPPDGATGAGILGDVVVGNRAGYSIGAHKFHFKSIQLRDFQPRFGPQSGGTRLQLQGSNLNVGSRVQVFLDELPCEVESSQLTSELLVCRTSSSRQPSRSIRHLKLIIDDAQIIRDDDDLFYYTQDPTILKISPLKAYLAGGRPINVYGTNLTSVQQPRMVIYEPLTGRKVNETNCILQDDSRMQCPAPAVGLPLMELELAEQQPGPVAPPGGSNSQPQPEAQVKFKVGFVLDNVPQQTSADIHYTADPKLFPFQSDQYKGAREFDQLVGVADDSIQQQLQPTVSSLSPMTSAAQFQLEPDVYLLEPSGGGGGATGPLLVLYGESLRAATSEYEITVTVGQDVCNLSRLSQSKLVCLMPADHMATPTDEDGHRTARALPLVVVRIGFNLRYELGYVQYHPQLVDQIVEAALASHSQQQQQQLMASSGFLGAADQRNHQLDAAKLRAQLLEHSAYPNYLPRESTTLVHRMANYLASAMMLVVYLTLAFCALLFVQAGARQWRLRASRRSAGHEYKRLLAKVDSIERSVRHECQLGSMALQGDLNELIRHVELSGVPLVGPKNFIMRVFFPGIQNHPLAAPSDASQHQQQQQQQQQQRQRHLAAASAADLLPMEQFQRLVMTKPFLIKLINTLEQQANFTLRDKINVASLLMIILIERPDYATDVMKTLLLQLIERSVQEERSRSQWTPAGASSLTSDSDTDNEQADERLDSWWAPTQQATSRPPRSRARLGRRASNLLSGLPIGKRHHTMSSGRAAASQLGKVVGDGASTLMAGTSVAAQMLLARVGNKTSPFHQPAAPSSGGAEKQHYAHQIEFTTTFNQHYGANLPQQRNIHTIYSLSNGRPNSRATARSKNRSHQRPRRTKTRRVVSELELMLRRTDSVVEKMLTNWLALNMYDHFNGPAGHSLYLLVEALRCQLERGPVDAITGDAYYSLNESKLLREPPTIHFEVVNLYVIVEIKMLHPGGHQMAPGVQEQQQMCLYDVDSTAHGPNSAGNSITLSLRVLDCDTISQVKAKILAALYRNSPNSTRLRPDEVELSLRQAQPHQQQYSTLVLSDEDYTSANSYTGLRRVNTLRHYGVTDHGIMTLTRCRVAPSRGHTGSALTDILDEHYNNPYAEIQYGHAASASSHQQQQQQLATANSRRVYHLAACSAELSHQSSPIGSGLSSSPSMLLLANGTGSQPTYQPSNCSNSSASCGQALDTHSTCINSTSVASRQQHAEQPIYCQIGSVHSAASQAQAGATLSRLNQTFYQPAASWSSSRPAADEQTLDAQLARMLTSKGTMKEHVDEFFRAILTTQRPPLGREQEPQLIAAAELNWAGACPAAVKWLFDLLDEAALKNGITDERVVDAWKSNAFLLRFWANFIKNPNYILDIDKSETLDASLSVIAQTLMSACAPKPKSKPTDEPNGLNRLLFEKDTARYRQLVRNFYQDVASLGPVRERDIVRQMAAWPVNSSVSFDTNFALKELCVYAVNSGAELMAALECDFECQQLELTQKLEQCFRCFTLFEAYQ